MDFIQESKSSVLIKIKAKPNAKAQSVQIIHNQYVKVQVKSPPDKNKANEEIVKIISKLLNISRSSVSIKRGLTSRDKLLEIKGISMDEILKYLH